VIPRRTLKRLWLGALAMPPVRGATAPSRAATAPARGATAALSAAVRRRAGFRRPCLFVAILAAVASAPAAGETVRLKATADAWISSHRGETGHTAGRHEVFKLKSIQEMALIRFDASAARGRRVRAARLYLHPAGKHMLRYVRVSTVAGDWVEGTRRGRLGPGDGASYDYADNAAKRPWSWPGSRLCDVIMGSGHTRTTWAEIKPRDGGWVSVALTPELIYALVAGDSDGLAVMDGGNIKYWNNHVHSVQSQHPPYVEVDVEGVVGEKWRAPEIDVRPAPDRAHVDAGAVRVTLPAQSAPDGRAPVCYRVTLNGKPVPRWRVPHPGGKAPCVFVLDDLAPSAKVELAVSPVSRNGHVQASEPVTITASPALADPPELARCKPPTAARGSAKPTVWAAPPLVKIDPVTGKAMLPDTTDDPRRANAVWDGGAVGLFGARAETVSFQLVVERPPAAGRWTCAVRPGALTGPDGARIAPESVSLFANWPARNRSKRWQPAYCVPVEPGAALALPDPARKLPGRTNRSFYVEVYVPRSAPPGAYKGAVRVTAGDEAVAVPVELDVLDFALPEELCFWPQLNSYRRPKRWHDYFRVARDNRCVWYYRFGSHGPPTTGKGRDLKIDWARWDRNYGPLLSGEAFKDCLGGPRPIETIALPFWDSWPTPLTKKTYDYQGHWPGKGEGKDHLIAHYMNAPYIGDALSEEYKAAFLAAQRQFVEHFKARGWTRTEAQCVFVGKITHRINYGINMWFHTDEPYHWDDWLALQFYNRLWRRGREAIGADPRRWVARADISRPQWQGRVLDDAIDTVYFGTGAIGSDAMLRRCRTLARETPLEMRVYGSASPDDASNTRSWAWIVSAWLNGAGAALPWQSLGSDKALDDGDAAVGGNALICPGDRFDAGPVADMRLKAFRDGEQLCEYLAILARRRRLNREQLRVMVGRALPLAGTVKAGASADNADALVFGRLKAWRIAALRRALADLIVSEAR